MITEVNWTIQILDGNAKHEIEIQLIDPSRPPLVSGENYELTPEMARERGYIAIIFHDEPMLRNFTTKIEGNTLRTDPYDMNTHTYKLTYTDIENISGLPINSPRFVIKIEFYQDNIVEEILDLNLIKLYIRPELNTRSLKFQFNLPRFKRLYPRVVLGLSRLKRNEEIYEIVEYKPYLFTSENNINRVDGIITYNLKSEIGLPPIGFAFKNPKIDLVSGIIGFIIGVASSITTSLLIDWIRSLGGK